MRGVFCFIRVWSAAQCLLMSILAVVLDNRDVWQRSEWVSEAEQRDKFGDWKLIYREGVKKPE